MSTRTLLLDPGFSIMFLLFYSSMSLSFVCALWNLP